MSIDGEKVQVRLLRESGLTLTEIAKRLGRSIYRVNARLNPKYEPHRERRVAAHETKRLDPEVVPNEMLSEEIDLIKSLRASGATYQTIADRGEAYIGCIPALTKAIAHEREIPRKSSRKRG